MIGLIWVLLLACAPCTGNGERPAPGWSFIQVRAQMQTVRKDVTMTTKLSVANHGTLLTPLSVTTSAEALDEQQIHPLMPPPPSMPALPRDQEYAGCIDPAATNYDPKAYSDDGSCYFTAVPPVFDYSFTANQRMSPIDALVMYQMGHIVGKLLDRYDIRWWVTDGSLLGTLRNKGIIPHDDDIDLNVLFPQVSQLKTAEFRNELHRNGLHLVDDPPRCTSGSTDCDLLPDDDKVYTDRMYIWNFTEYNRTRGQPNERGTRMKLDLWPLEYVGGKWQQLHATEHAFPGSLCDVLPFSAAGSGKYKCRLERRHFGLDEVWAPSQVTSESYLVNRYGDWNAAPECIGTLHDCHLIENTTHDMARYAEPAGPLVEPVGTAEI